MKQKWGREGYAGEWPSSKPVWTIAAFFVALASVAAICVYRYERVWTPLQRFYLTQYLASGTNPIRKSSRYLLLNAVDKKGSRLALDEEVVPTTADESTFALTEEAVKAGDLRLEWQRGQFDNAKIHAYLGHWIYGDQTFMDLAKPALWGGLWVFAFGLIVAVPKDRARRRERKEGRRLKGPELVSVREFNRRNRSDGIGFVQERTLLEKLFGQTPSLNLPQRMESSHILIMGDSGTGKSALVRQVLMQIEARREAAIVYDPALEYTPQFYKPERGDVILNPLDARMPYWNPSDELGHDVEATTLAASLFPDRHNDNPFFVESPRKIFAHLLTFRPEPEELVWWMCHEEEIDKRVKGTEYAAMIDKQAPQQRFRDSIAKAKEALKNLDRKSKEAKELQKTLTKLGEEGKGNIKINFGDAGVDKNGNPNLGRTVGKNITINYDVVDSVKSGWNLNPSESAALDAGVTTHEGTHAGGGPSVLSFLGMHGEHAAYFTESVTYEGLHNNDRPFQLWNNSWLTVDQQQFPVEKTREQAIQRAIHPDTVPAPVVPTSKGPQ